MAKMRAVRLFAPGDLRCVEIDAPHIENEEDVIIKVKFCGICGSDIPRVMSKGTYKYPITIGHEFSGEVFEIGSKVTNVAPGDRVTVMPLIPCGICSYCKIGYTFLCDEYEYYGSRIDGAMADYIRVSADNCLKLPAEVDWEMGSMTDPASVALHAVRKADIEPGQSAAVFGLGAIGLLGVQWLKAIGCGKVFAMDIFDEKLELAKKLGADFCINVRKESAIDKIFDLTEGRGVDAAIEIAGSETAQVQAIQAVRKAGKVVLCGISYNDLTIPNKTLSKILRGELEIIGAWNSSNLPLPMNEWESSISFMKTGKIRTKPIITHRYGLEECQKAFEMMHNRTEVFIKVLFEIEV